MEPAKDVHEAGCHDPECEGCWTGVDDERGPAPDDLREAVETIQAENQRRLAGITAKLGKPPNLTLGLIDFLADELLGAGTTRRYLFTLRWEAQVAVYCEAQEAEIRKAELALNNNGANPATLRSVPRSMPGGAGPHIPGL